MTSSTSPASYRNATELFLVLTLVVALQFLPSLSSPPPSPYPILLFGSVSFLSKFIHGSIFYSISLAAIFSFITT